MPKGSSNAFNCRNTSSFRRLKTYATAVFVCMKRDSLLAVPRAACCPCETVALADKPPVALFQLQRRWLRSTHSSENRCNPASSDARKDEGVANQSERDGGAKTSALGRQCRSRAGD